jgi:hypothetical protein
MTGIERPDPLLSVVVEGCLPRRFLARCLRIISSREGVGDGEPLDRKVLTVVSTAEFEPESGLSECSRSLDALDEDA